MTPTDELWIKLMPLVAPLPSEKRTAAMAYVLDQTSGKEIDDALIRNLMAELRKRFGGAGGGQLH
jgi:hypothetical protein